MSRFRRNMAIATSAAVRERRGVIRRSFRAAGAAVAVAATVSVLAAGPATAAPSAGSATAMHRLSTNAYLYWTGGATGMIGRSGIYGSGVKTDFIAAGKFGDSSTSGVALGRFGNYIYWTDTQKETIGRADLDGTHPNDKLIPGVLASTLAVSSNYIYWTNYDGSIGRANLDGTHVKKLIGYEAMDVVVGPNGNYIYWTNLDSTSPPYSTSIIRADLDGSHYKPIAVLNGEDSALAVDNNYCYFSDSGGIGRVNLDGTSPPGYNFIPTAQPVNGIALGPDGDYIYWTEGPSGTYPTIGRAYIDGTGIKDNFIPDVEAWNIAAS